MRYGECFSLPSCDVVKLLYVLLHEAQSCCPVVACYLQPCSEDISQHFLNLVFHQLPRNPAFDGNANLIVMYFKEMNIQCFHLIIFLN